MRQWVARNPKTDITILTILATDVDFTVRAFVAWNPTATPELLNLMLSDPNLTVRRMAETVLDNR